MFGNLLLGNTHSQVLKGDGFLYIYVEQPVHVQSFAHACVKHNWCRTLAVSESCYYACTDVLVLSLLILVLCGVYIRLHGVREVTFFCMPCRNDFV